MYLTILQVSLVSNDGNGKSGFFLWLNLQQELLVPLLEGLKRIDRCDIKDEQAAVRSPIKGSPQRMEPFCTSCIPDLESGREREREKVLTPQVLRNLNGQDEKVHHYRMSYIFFAMNVLVQN